VKEAIMRPGFTLPYLGHLAHQPQEISRFAAEAERLGAASLWVGDRLLAPAEPTVGYGGTMEIPEAFHHRPDQRRTTGGRIRYRLVTGGVPGRRHPDERARGPAG
jgi:hypothetical protein